MNKQILKESINKPTVWDKNEYVLINDVNVYSKLDIPEEINLGFMKNTKLIFHPGSELDAKNIIAYQVDNEFNRLNAGIDGGMIFYDNSKKKFSINNVPMQFGKKEDHYLLNLG